MRYTEKKGNLFSVNSEYVLAQCISADFAMGLGIAIDFNMHFNTKQNLVDRFHGNALRIWDERFCNKGLKGMCIKDTRVYNLVTKRQYWEKPTYNTIRCALLDMREQMIENGDTKVAMPKIGCGLDKLLWEKVSNIIKDVFSDTDIEITVFYL